MAYIENETNLRVCKTLKNVNHSAYRVMFCLYAGTQYVAGQMVFQILAEIS